MFLILCLVLAFVLRVYAAIQLPNIHWPDEIYQSLEPAHRLAYGYGIVTWEYVVGARSWVFPGILAGVMRLSGWVRPASSGYLLGIRIFLCLLSLSAVAFAYRWGEKASGTGAAVAAGVLSAAWFELIFYASKAFSEVVAAHLLLAAIYLAIFGCRWSLRTRLFLSGALCGFVCGLRIHLLPMVLALMIYACRREWKGKWAPMLTGMVVLLTAFGLLDAATWSYPFQSFIVNVRENYLPQRLQSGTEPWHYYFGILAARFWPLAPFLILGLRRSPILAWLIVSVLLPHSMIPHKEFRYVYPVLPLMVTLAGLGINEAALAATDRSSPKLTTFATAVLLSFCIGISAWFAAEFPGWRTAAGNLRAFQWLSRESSVCGVGLWKIAWFETGGYTYLHKNIPIFLLRESANTPARWTPSSGAWISFSEAAPGLNFVAASEPLPTEYGEYHLQQCWGTTCLYKREGNCIQVSGYTLNKALQGARP